MPSLHVILIILFLIFELFAALNVPKNTAGLNLMALGLFCFALSLLV